MSGNVLYFIFAVNGQQPDFILLLLEVVDHPHASPLALSSGCPAYFAKPSAPGDDLPGLRAVDEHSLQFPVLVICQQFEDLPGEDRRFDDDHY